MSAEANKALARRVAEELYNQGDLAVADQVFADNYVEHHPLPPGFPSGRDAVKQFAAGLRSAFPDFHYTVEDEIADADRVVLRLTARGTHLGDWPLLGIPATGRQASWSEVHIVRVADGQIVEHWPSSDQLGLVQQLSASA
jgi:predicted ester cyclase